MSRRERAAACPLRWLRGVLIAIPVYVAVARLDLERHFLSDVAASAVIAAVYTLLAALALQRWRPAATAGRLATVPPA